MSKKPQIYNWDRLPVVLNVHTVALIFDCADDTVKKWLQSGRLQGVKIGRAWVVDKEYLREVVAGKGVA